MPRALCGDSGGPVQDAPSAPPHTTRTDSNPEEGQRQAEGPCLRVGATPETRREPPTAPSNPQGPEDNPDHLLSSHATPPR